MKQAALLVFISLFLFCFNLKAQELQTSSSLVSISPSIEPYEGKSRRAKRFYEAQKRMLELHGGICTYTEVIFTAKLSNELKIDEKSKIKFKWIVSGGNILAGQDTPSIKVQGTESSEKIDVTVELENLPKRFSKRENQASSSVYATGACDIDTCSTISIESPEIIFDTSKTFTVRARLGDYEMEETATYEWEVTNGYILEGQGTKEIKVVFQGDNDGNKCIITLKIKDDDLGPECPSTAMSIVTLRK